MSDIKSAANPLFLREEELRQGIELLFYAYRDFTSGPDAMLASLIRAAPYVDAEFVIVRPNNFVSWDTRHPP